MSNLLSARINRLFAVMHKRDEPELSTRAAAAAITARTGVRVSAQTLAELRAGTATADDETAAAITKFFGVPPRYLRPGPAVDIDRQLDLLCALRDQVRIGYPCRRGMRATEHP